jgi:hypothetical protein
MQSKWDARNTSVALGWWKSMLNASLNTWRKNTIVSPQAQIILKWNLSRVWGLNELSWTGSGCGPMAGPCEHSNKASLLKMCGICWPDEWLRVSASQDGICKSTVRPLQFASNEREASDPRCWFWRNKKKKISLRLLRHRGHAVA